MSTAIARPDPLSNGFYTVGDVARLLQIESRRKVIGWIAGYRGGIPEAVISRDYPPLGNTHELSFWDLMEVRFIYHFRKQGVPMQTLRRIASKARSDLDVRHPFALSKVKYLTDRKRVFAQVIEETGDRRTMDILGDQYEMYDVIEHILAQGVAFDPQTSMAENWQPLLADCPNVYVNPKFAYGQPVISGRYIPTSALFRSWRAEGGDFEGVADWYGVGRDHVREAVEFEARLSA